MRKFTFGRLINITNRRFADSFKNKSNNFEGVGKFGDKTDQETHKKKTDDKNFEKKEQDYGRSDSSFGKRDESCEKEDKSCDKKK